MKPKKSLKIKSISSFYLLLFTFALLLLNCGGNDSTSPETNTFSFSGSVTLEGETDFSGVTVALYDLVELDTALVRINQQYPNIGVQISQETEFDHREHTPIATATTDASGNWEIKGIEDKEYNVVVSKDGFGWKYTYSQKSGTSNFDLNKTILQRGILNGNIVWENGKTYILEGDVIVDTGANLTIQGNVWVLGKANSRLIVNGTVTKTATDFTRFTSEINSAVWRGILINSANNSLSNLILNNITSGISMRNASNTLRNCKISDASISGISLSQNINSCNLNNLTLVNNFVGIDVADSDNLTKITNSVIIESIQEGITMIQSDLEFSNNYVSKNQTGIVCWFESNAVIRNNTVEKNAAVGLEISGSTPNVTFNNIISNGSQAVYIAPRGYNAISKPTINRNNLSSNTSEVFRIVGTAASFNSENISAENNWWFTNDVNSLNNMIIDKNDYDPSDTGNYPYTGIVLFNPLLTANEPAAGIIN